MERNGAAKFSERTGVLLYMCAIGNKGVWDNASNTSITKNFEYSFYGFVSIYDIKLIDIYRLTKLEF
jgi:hypothetical protein